MLTTIDLKKFCNTENTSIAMPFFANGYTYATNSALCIRLEGKHAEENDFAPVDAVERSIDWDHDEVVEWTTLPDFEPKYQVCLICDGTGKVATCPECDGVGEIYFFSGYNEYSCKCNTCLGKKVKSTDREGAPCMACAGECFTIIHESLPFSTISPEYGLNSAMLMLLLELPGVLIEKEPRQPYVLPEMTTKIVPPVRFRFDGGLGVLMPAKANK